MTAQPDVEATSDDRRMVPPRGIDLVFDRFDPIPAPDSIDPLGWPGYQLRLGETKERVGHSQAVSAGIATTEEQACVGVVFDFDFFGGSIGQAEGELIVRAVTEAGRRGLPLVTVSRSGGARMQEGSVSLFQMPRIARALVELSDAGMPHIAVAEDPTTGGVWASLVASADVIIAGAGAQIAFAGNRIRSAPEGELPPTTAEGKYGAGFVDQVVTESQLRSTVGVYLRLLSPNSRGEPDMPTVPRPQPSVMSEVKSGWNSVLAARDPKHVRAEEYLSDYFEFIAPIWGDRKGGADPNMLCGFGRNGDRTIAFICQRGGVSHASGFRTAARAIALADRLRIPVLTLVDTTGADNSPNGEREGVGTAIAELLQQLARCRVPILSVVTGQGISGGAISLIAPDNLWMAPDSFLAVTAPESAAAILKRSADAIPAIADQLALSPEQLQELGLVRGIL